MNFHSPPAQQPGPGEKAGPDSRRRQSSSHRLSIYGALVAAAFIGAHLCAEAAEVRDISEIGPHHPILVVEKNVHPQNVMVVYTKVDEAGRFVTDVDQPNRPMLGFYWLMDGKTYKPVNEAIKAEIRKRFDCQWASATRDHVAVNVNDLKEVRSDIEATKIDVYSVGTGNARDVEVQMKLGPSDRNAMIRLSSIYTEGRVFPPAVHSVILKGEEISTGKRVVRKYEAVNKTG